jgi:Ni,Fe-hydrogenase I large subunit
MARIVIDPVTRIEGHLRIEAAVENGKVVDAWSSGQMFRGIEIILKGRDPRDAWLFCQRICGVCTTCHALASVRAVENALGMTIPDNARIMRNIISAVQLVHDHIVHFYHLHALDWVDVLSALKADPARTASIARSISDWPNSRAAFFGSVQKRVKGLADTGQLGPFANGYWGHPAYKLPPEVNLLGVAHYLEALDVQRSLVKVHALLGSKNPHLQTFLVGGMARPVDPNSQNAVNADAIALISRIAKQAVDFVGKVYLPDVLAIASYYKEWADIGAGIGNYMTYGEFPKDNRSNTDNMLIPKGIILKKDLTKMVPVDQQKISEHVTRSWYSYGEGDTRGKHPWEGETAAKYTGPRPPYDHLDTQAKYTWLKTPRYEEMPMEVGPLARVLVAYASDHKRTKETVDSALGKLGVRTGALFSTLGRVAARCIETVITAEAMQGFIDELAGAVSKGDYRICQTDKWEPRTWPKEAKGYGFSDAPRGALGHWISIKDGKIANYQMVVPSTWNLSPRDGEGVRGAMEQSLIGTPVADPERPLEILRTVHSFDPCVACAVHVTDAGGRPITVVKRG